MSTVTIVLLVILVILIAAVIALYFFGKNAQKNQDEQQAQIQANKQTVSMLVIDKKKTEDQKIPVFRRWSTSRLRSTCAGQKVPVVKAKVGPKVMTLMADERVFAALPVKTEAKVVVSGLYITEIKSVRGGAIPQAPKKKRFLCKIQERQLILSKCPTYLKHRAREECKSLGIIIIAVNSVALKIILIIPKDNR